MCDIVCMYDVCMGDMFAMCNSVVCVGMLLYPWIRGGVKHALVLMWGGVGGVSRSDGSCAAVAHWEW